MYDWMIHVVSSSEEDEDIYPGMCDAHTHGLDKYGHLEFQFVLAYPYEFIGQILNGIGERVKNGETFQDGDLIDGFLKPPAKLKVFKTTDAFGNDVLRLLVPDGKYRWPEDSDEYPYSMQQFSPYYHPIGDSASRHKQ